MLVHTMITIEDLYPGMEKKDVDEATNNLDQYAALVLRIFERTESESDPQPGPLAPPADPLC